MIATGAVMGKSERRKGQVAERDVAAILSEYGFIARRTPLSGGMDWKGDLRSPDGESPIPGVHIEVKRQERLYIPSWIRQAEADCPEGDTAIVVFRQSREPWRVVATLEHYLSIQHRLRQVT